MARPWLGLALLGGTNALLLLWGSTQGIERQLAATLAGACVGGVALAWIAFDRRFERVPVAAILLLALLLRGTAALASPLLEDDHYRYLWDGLRSATALDPYRLPPEAFFGDTSLAPRWQEVLSGINHPELPTIYGPLLQVLFALGYSLAPGQLAPLQALLVAVDMAVLAVLAWQRVSARWLLAYALHPLVLKEAIASAHPDGLVALCLLLALVAWQRRRAAWVGAMLGLAVGAKVAALVALPLLVFAPLSQAAAPRAGLRWALIVCAVGAATVAALYAPFVLGGGSDAVALGAFGTHWRFNPLLYRVLEAALPTDAARPVAALCILGGIGAIALFWQRHAAAAPPPLHAAFLLLLLFSPVVNPWYWLWALPLAVAARRAGVVAMGVVASLSYLNSSVLAGAGMGADVAPYSVAWSWATVQLAVLAAAWGWASMDARRSPIFGYADAHARAPVVDRDARARRGRAHRRRARRARSAAPAGRATDRDRRRQR